MTSTTTYTSTTTFTRIELISIQMRNLLRQTTDLYSNALSKLEIGLEKHYIKKVSVYALDSAGLCRGEVFLALDWDEHDRQIYRGNINITADKKWTNNVAIEVEEAINLFMKFVEKNGLKTQCRIHYISSVYADKTLYQRANQELGLADAEAIKWVNGQEPTAKDTWKSKVRTIEELTSGCRFLFD